MTPGEISRGEIIAFVVFAASALIGCGGSIGYLMFGGWRGAFMMWIMFAALLIALAGTVALCTWLGIGPVKR